MLQHWGNKKVWDFFCSKSDRNSFDTIIRIRPDLWIHRFQKPRNMASNECFAPWWGKFGGINDRLAIMGTVAAANYFNVYSDIDIFLNQGCPFHPETLLNESLRLRNIIINPLMTEFSTMRMDGSQRWAEIVMSDMAELIASR